MTQASHDSRYSPRRLRVNDDGNDLINHVTTGLVAIPPVFYDDLLKLPWLLTVEIGR